MEILTELMDKDSLIKPNLNKFLISNLTNIINEIWKEYETHITKEEFDSYIVKATSKYGI
jgi:hypothetical protein